MIIFQFQAYFGIYYFHTRHKAFTLNKLKNNTILILILKFLFYFIFDIYIVYLIFIRKNVL